jgi:ABC-type amino acid transport substrate-binding protein
MRGADEKTVTKINNILKKLLNNKKIQDIYASYGVEYVSPK